MKPIVAHVIRSFLRPSETFVRNQMVHLRTFDPFLLCHHRIPGSSCDSVPTVALSEIMGNRDRRWQGISYRYLRHLTADAASAGALRIHQARAEILHFHFLVDARFFLPMRRRLLLPAIVSGYGWDISKFPVSKMGLGRLYLKPLFTQMQMFIAMSELMKSDLLGLGCPESKIIVHYHGIDTKRFIRADRSYANGNAVRVLFCARLVPEKSPETLIEALRIVREDLVGSDLPECVVSIVGDGPLRPKLEGLVRQFGLNDMVSFRGHIQHLDDALVHEYHGADIFILPSRTHAGSKEGIPGTLVEAMSAGLPVISTRHGGIPSIIRDGSNGLLVEEGDANGIARHLLMLIRSPDLRSRIGCEAARTAKGQCDVEDRTKILESIYVDVMKSWRSTNSPVSNAL